MKCPNCGGELRNGLSFCPKCGNIVSKDENKSVNNNPSTQAKSKASLWKIILGIMFFPITLTIIIVKNKKMQPAVKIALIVLLWVFIFVVGATNSEDSKTGDESNPSNSYIESTVGETSTEEATEENTEATNTVKYHGNEQVNNLLTDYNAVAECPITPEMVENGAYNYSANVSCNGVWIMVYATSNNGIFVDYQDEAASDKNVKQLFKGFCKALNADITDEDVNVAWAALQTGQYKNYNAYDFEGIECTYVESLLANGEHRYIIKTNCKTYS